MYPTLTLAVLLGAITFGDPPPLNAQTTYEGLAAQVGKGADAQVKLALWCEANGLDAERIKHLGVAVAIAPYHTQARALLGLVKEGGKWRHPEEVAEEFRADKALTATLAEYNARREAAPDSADSHWRLGLWCEEKGLKAEAKAHFAAVTRLDPARDAAWKRLGCKRYGNQWMTPESAAAEKSEAETQHKAHTRWVNWLKVRKTRLASDRRVSDSTLEELASLSDPRAASAVWTVFVTGSESDQRRAADLLGQLDGTDAALDLGALAVISQFPSVRTLATETLARRDAREAINRLVEMVVTPLKYEVRHVNGPGLPGVLYLDGELFKIRRIYDAPLPRLSLQVVEPAADSAPLAATPAVVFTAYQHPAQKETGKNQRQMGREQPRHTPEPAQPKANSPSIPQGGGMPVPGLPQFFTPMPWSQPWDGQGFANGRPPTDAELREGWRREDRAVQNQERALRNQERALAIERNWLEARKAAASAEQVLAADLAAVQDYNAGATEINDRVLPVLQTVTGRKEGPDRQSWKSWWTDQRGYAYNRPAKLTFVEHAANVYKPNFVAIPRASTSCFVAGTPVRTVDGTRSIDALRIGDRILTQDTRTGVLTYQPVLKIFHNQPAPTLKIDLGGASVVATPIHRFWRAGKGWVLARELKPGDLVRTIGGTTRVVEIKVGTVEPVFNLEVGEGHSFFVGVSGALVHDNSEVRSQDRRFDATTEVATLSPAAAPIPGS